MLFIHLFTYLWTSDAPPETLLICLAPTTIVRRLVYSPPTSFIYIDPGSGRQRGVGVSMDFLRETLLSLRPEIELLAKRGRCGGER